MKHKYTPNHIAGFIALVFPFLAYALTVFWFNLAVVPFTDDVELYVSSPTWWQQLGLNSQQWLAIGFVPGMLCGLYGITAIVCGSGPTVAKGFWSLLAAPVVIFLYMLATF